MFFLGIRSLSLYFCYLLYLKRNRNITTLDKAIRILVYFNWKLRLFLAPQGRFILSFLWHKTSKISQFWSILIQFNSDSDWTGLLIQRIDPDNFIRWHPSMIAGAESTIAGVELSIGGGGSRATRKVGIQIDTTGPAACPGRGGLKRSLITFWCISKDI